MSSPQHPFGQIADGCSETSLTHRHGPACILKKVDPPGGATGRVGFGTEVDEAPVPDANPRQKRFRAKRHSGSREENASKQEAAFSESEVVCVKKTLLKQKPSQPQKSVTAGPHAADVVAESVELADPAA